MLKKVTLLTGLVGILSSYSHLSNAQTATEANNKEILERIERKVDRLTATADKADAAFLDQPLGDRTQGVEFNFFRLLTLGQEEETLSGTYSRFDTDKNVELAFPIMFTRAEHDYPFENDKQTSLTLDFHYRKYLGERLNGFYISGFSRAAYISGILDDGDNFDFFSEPNRDVNREENTEFKLGLGVGIGYRVISTSGFYWGASLSVGRYLIGDSDIFHGSDGASSELDDAEVIFDIELLKFGYAF